MAQSGSGAVRWAARIGEAAAVAFIVGPAMAHFGAVPPLAGFAVFDLGGLLGLIALVTAIVAAVRGHGIGSGLGFGAGITVVFLAVAVPSAKVPPINDITTDAVNPPQFAKAGTLPGNQGRDMKYPGAAFAEQQRAGYGEIAPLRLPLPPDEAFKRVVAAAGQMPDWEITRSDNGAHVLEGVATSRLFRFKDDFVIEVRPDSGGSAVHMRSKSRDGKGDVGANAARIRSFFAKLQP